MVTVIFELCVLYYSTDFASRDQEKRGWHGRTG